MITSLFNDLESEVGQIHSYPAHMFSNIVSDLERNGYSISPRPKFLENPVFDIWRDVTSESNLKKVGVLSPVSKTAVESVSEKYLNIQSLRDEQKLEELLVRFYDMYPVTPKIDYKDL